MKVAVMQPYFMPYLGYYKLIAVSDLFIVLDDVNYIKNGWINRNRISGKDSISYLTLPTFGLKNGMKIFEVKVNFNKRKVLNQIYNSYTGSLNFEIVYKIFEDVLDTQSDFIADYAFQSILKISAFLNLNTKFLKSKDIRLDIDKTGVNRVIELCKFTKASVYYNLPGGKDLYSSEIFQKSGINLKFIDPPNILYKNKFGNVNDNLSILDVLMNVHKDEIIKILNYDRI